MQGAMSSGLGLLSRRSLPHASAMSLFERLVALWLVAYDERNGRIVSCSERRDKQALGLRSRIATFVDTQKRGGGRACGGQPAAGLSMKWSQGSCGRAFPTGTLEESLRRNRLYEIKRG